MIRMDLGSGRRFALQLGHFCGMGVIAVPPTICFKACSPRGRSVASITLSRQKEGRAIESRSLRHWGPG